MDNREKIYDSVVIGGGAAGLSAALVLARAHAKVLVIDSVKQSNRVSSGTHGVFTRDGTPPAELYEIAKEQLEQYPTYSYINDAVVDSKSTDGTFQIVMQNGQSVVAKTIVLAQGVEYVLPEIPGLKDLWGSKVWHCPFCYGYEATGKKVLVIGSPEKQAHMQQLMPRWTENSSYASPSDIRNVENLKVGVRVTFVSGETENFDGIFSQTTSESRDALADALQCKRSPQGIVEVDDFGETSISNVYSVGDQSTMRQQVNFAVASGHKAAIAIVMRLQGIEH